MTDTVPEPFSLPVVLCPACEHGIDVHKGWREACNLGGSCSCMWTPNDIAATLQVAAAREVADRVEAVLTARVRENLAAPHRRGRVHMIQVRAVRAALYGEATDDE